MFDESRTSVDTRPLSRTIPLNRLPARLGSQTRARAESQDRRGGRGERPQPFEPALTFQPVSSDVTTGCHVRARRIGRFCLAAPRVGSQMRPPGVTVAEAYETTSQSCCGTKAFITRWRASPRWRAARLPTAAVRDRAVFIQTAFQSQAIVTEAGMTASSRSRPYRPRDRPRPCCHCGYSAKARHHERPPRRRLRQTSATSVGSPHRDRPRRTDRGLHPRRRPRSPPN
jgi:hypothetical protein